MKKIFAALMLLAASLAMVVGTSSSASAETCGTESSIGRKTFAVYRADGVTISGWYEMQNTLRYTLCYTNSGSRRAYINSYSIRVTEKSGGCGVTDYFRFFPEEIGAVNSWDPSSMTAYCASSDDVDLLRRDAPTPSPIVYPGSTRDASCIDTTLYIYDNYGNRSVGYLEDVCVKEYM